MKISNTEYRMFLFSGFVISTETNHTFRTIVDVEQKDFPFLLTLDPGSEEE